MARAQLVEERWSFVLADLAGAGEAACYHLRQSGTALCIRHGTTDQFIFDEVFRRRLYDPPAPVAAALQGGGAGLRVVDLGGHVGLFGAYVRSRYPGVRITAFEPDPENRGLLQRVVAENQAGRSWEVIPACASTRDEVVEFAPAKGSRSRVESAPGRDTVPTAAVDVFAHLRDADLVKLDIEGAEWPILADPRLAEVPLRAAVLEYHPHMAPEPDARAAAVKLLESAGYQTQPIFHSPEGHGMLWAWAA